MPSFAAVVNALNMAAAIAGAAFAAIIVISIAAIFYKESSPAPVEIYKAPRASRSHDLSLLTLLLFILSSALCMLSTTAFILSSVVFILSFAVSVLSIAVSVLSTAFDAAVAALTPLRCSPAHKPIAASFDHFTVKDSHSRLPKRSKISDIDATPLFDKLSIKESLPAPRFPRRKADKITARLETLSINDFGPRSIPVTSAVDVEIEMSDAPAATTTTTTADITPGFQQLTIEEPALRSRPRKSAPPSRYQRSVATAVEVLPPTFTTAFEGLQVKPKSCLKAASKELPVKIQFPFVPVRCAEPVQKKKVHFQFFSDDEANKEDGVIVSELHYFEAYNDTSSWSDPEWRLKLAKKYARGINVPHIGRRRMQLVIDGKLRLCKESGGFLTTEPIQYHNFVRPRCGYTRTAEGPLHPVHHYDIIEHELRWSKSFKAHCPLCGRG